MTLEAACQLVADWYNEAAERARVQMRADPANLLPAHQDLAERIVAATAEDPPRTW